MGVARFNLYIQSLLLVFNFKVKVNRRWEEIAALSFFWVWHVALLSTIDTKTNLIIYLLLSHMIAGITHL
jgi:hypothetical protein